MMNVLQTNVKRPDFRSGDIVKVHVKIIEGENERTQVIEGLVMRKRGQGNDATFTIRKISYGVGVECTYLYNSPRVSKVEVVKKSKERKARLYYLRKVQGKLFS